MSTKIVIVAGQEFSVPATTSNGAIREQLKQMGFADVANATIQTGTKDGIPTVEFVKKAGTKGLDPTRLVAALARARHTPVPAVSAEMVMWRFVAGDVTWGEAVADALDRYVQEYANTCADATEGCGGSRIQAKGVQVCARLDLPAVPIHADAW
jgi:hypothetical protein